MRINIKGKSLHLSIATQMCFSQVALAELNSFVITCSSETAAWHSPSWNLLASSPKGAWNWLRKIWKYNVKSRLFQHTIAQSLEVHGVLANIPSLSAGAGSQSLIRDIPGRTSTYCTVSTLNRHVLSGGAIEFPPQFPFVHRQEIPHCRWVRSHLPNREHAQAEYTGPLCKCHL